MLLKMVKRLQTRENVNYKNISIKNTQTNSTKRLFSRAKYHGKLNSLTNEEFYKILNEEIGNIKT